MPSPTFRTRKQWFNWYSKIYLNCYHWKHVVRPAVFKYRKGICCFCNKKILNNYWHCHHGKGMYKHLGKEHTMLDQMFIAHVPCHTKHTKKERRGRVVKKVLKALF